MGIEVTWDNDTRTIIRYCYGQEWTWDDFQTATDTSNRMIAGVSQTVDVIADFTQGTPPPMGAFGRFRAGYENAPENAGVVVVVGGSFVVQALVATFSRLYTDLSHRLMRAGSVEEAREKLDQLRARRD